MFNGILPLNRSQTPSDIVAGLTLATLAIPEVMGYTRISGTPVITGLFTILIPMMLYAFLGSSRHLVVGADSATAAVLAAGLVGIATIGSPEYVAYASLLALLAGIMLLAARLVKLGFLADFLSRTVLIGFLTGVGIQVAVSQLPDMLGLPGHSLNPVQELATDIPQISKTNIYSLIISIAVLAVIFSLRKTSKRIPAALIAILSTIVLSYVFNLSSHVSVLGQIPSGLPQLGWPNVPITWNILQQLLPPAFSMFVIILAQSAATSRAYAVRYNEEFSENADLVALGIANLGAGLSGTFVVNGSPTKTEMVDNAGGRSQISQLTTVCVILVVLLFLTRPLSYMPNAVLAAIVFVIAVELVDVRDMSEIFVERPVEFWVATLTAGIVVFVGVEQGIIAAMVLSLFAHTRHGYRPSNSLFTVDNHGLPQSVPVGSGAQFLPGLIIYRFNHSMYYANADLFKTEALRLTDGAHPPISWFCLDGAAMDDVDFSAAAALRETYELLKQRSARLVLVEIQESVRAELERSKITDLVGRPYIFSTIQELENAYKQSSTGTLRETPRN
jgi:high affinity sulfate transporter 1